MDLFKEFNAFEDMGKMDYDLLVPADFELAALINEEYVRDDDDDPMIDALDVFVCAYYDSI